MSFADNVYRANFGALGAKAALSEVFNHMYETAERRKTLAQGASRGDREEITVAPEGRKNVAQRAILTPLRGWLFSPSNPTAGAVG
jgi:hypothetical protein